MRIVSFIFLLFVAVRLFAADGQNGMQRTAIDGDSVSVARTFDYFYLQALSLKEQERYDEAFCLLEHCLTLQPDAAAVLYELSAIYSYLGRKEEAIDMMKRAVACDPGNYWYREVLANAYDNDGRRSEAIAVYEQMARDFRSHSEIHMLLASMYADEGEYAKSVQSLDAVERVEGKSEQLALHKYRLYMLMQNREAAIGELKSLADEYPDDNRLRVFLGDAYHNTGDKERAFEIYTGVLDDDSCCAEAQLSLANYYLDDGNDSLFTVNMEKLLMNERYSGEERVSMLVKFASYKERSDTTGYNHGLFNRLMKLPFGQAETAEVYANYLQMKGVGEDSIAPVLETILKYEPENNFAQLQLLGYAIERNDRAEVISRCDTAILYNPEVLELYYYRGIACYQEGRSRDAISSFEKGLEMRTAEHDDGFISNIYGLIGDTYHELGNLDACVQAYDSALVYNASNVSVLNNYAYYLALAGTQLERAEEMSLLTIKAEPENTIYIDTYMWILFLLERYDEAKAYAVKLLSAGGDISAVEHRHCGDIYAKCGDIELAVEQWRLAQEKGDDSKLLAKKIKKRKYIPDEKKK